MMTFFNRNREVADEDVKYVWNFRIGSIDPGNSKRFLDFFHENLFEIEIADCTRQHVCSGEK